MQCGVDGLDVLFQIKRRRPASDDVGIAVGVVPGEHAAQPAALFYRAVEDLAHTEGIQPPVKQEDAPVRGRERIDRHVLQADGQRCDGLPLFFNLRPQTVKADQHIVLFDPFFVAEYKYRA